MAKGKKRTKGLRSEMPSIFKEPTPQERMERAAEHLVREAVEASPKFKPTARKLARMAKVGASKIVGKTKGDGDESLTT